MTTCGLLILTGVAPVGACDGNAVPFVTTSLDLGYLWVYSRCMGCVVSFLFDLYCSHSLGIL